MGISNQSGAAKKIWGWGARAVCAMAGIAIVFYAGLYGAKPVRAQVATATSAAAPGTSGSVPTASAATPPANQPAAEAEKSSSAQAKSTAASAAAAASSTGVPGITAAEAAAVMPPPADFDVQSRGREVLAHLNAVIRFYRMSLSQIQKVGEPSDLLYREQAINQAERTGELAFESARAEALLLTAYQKRAGSTSEQGEGEAQRLQSAKNTVAQRLTELKAQDKALDAQMQKPKAKQLPDLQQQKEQIAGAIELNTAMSEALGRIVGMSDTRGKVGLAGDVERLERGAPELADKTLKQVVSAPLQSPTSESSSGVSSQAQVLFSLLGTQHSIDQWLQTVDALHAQALALRTPLTNIVRSTVKSGQALSDQTQQAIASGTTSSATVVPSPPQPKQTARQIAATVAAADAAELVATRKSFTAVTSTFNVLSAAAVPLSQEIITLEQTRANLLAWRSTVHEEYRGVLRKLLTRVCVIAAALLLIWGAGEVWRRTTMRYVHDIRRRRQLLVMRRLIVGFLSGLVVIFGFVTQFNSLATFAGFITAGLAVGLQTILLSVAAYFFIIGRYGVKVGDRITVASVTGDVIDVGLVRFYMMELAGSGTELRPTGRVAVFSNSVLFQAGTPLYKQMPGTEYAWHELTMKLIAGADYRKAVTTVEGAVTTIYNGYKQEIEQQHRDLESWMDADVDRPSVECRLQLVDGGLQLNIRFPVGIRNAAQVDEKVTERLLTLMQDDAEVKAAVSSGPEIKATVKG